MASQTTQAGRVTASAVMHHGVITCPPQSPLGEVAARMAHHCVHCVVVHGLAAGPHGSERLVWGIVSDLDLMRAAAAGEMDAQAGAIAATEVVTVTPDDDLAKVAQLMSEHESSHLVVVSPAGAPVGVVSSLDVAGGLAPSLRSGGRGA